jgi:hypothetical protein
MANWKVIFEDARVMFCALSLIVIVVSIVISWCGFLIILIPIAFLAGWIGARKK